MSFGDVQRLRAFALVLDLGSISAAASVLGYTQSAVSQQLAALEREVGAALVDRAQRPLRADARRRGPAPARRPRPRRARERDAAASRTCAAARRGCGWPPSQRAVLVRAGRLRDLRRAHPSSWSCRCSSSRRTRRSSACAPARPISRWSTTCRAWRCPRRRACDGAPPRRPPARRPPGGHRLARRDVIDLADLEGEPLILPRRDTPAGRFRSLVEHLCAQAGFAPRVAYELDDLPAAQAFAAAGIALVPMHGSRSRPFRGRHRAAAADAAAGSRADRGARPAHGLDTRRRGPARAPGGRREPLRDARDLTTAVPPLAVALSFGPFLRE